MGGRLLVLVALLLALVRAESDECTGIPQASSDTHSLLAVDRGRLAKAVVAENLSTLHRAQGGRRRATHFDCFDNNIPHLQKSDRAVGDLVQKYHPRFDFDGDSCYPAAALSRTAEKNAGQKPSGGTNGCRESDWMEHSNTYHRFAKKNSGGSEYQAHVFDLYFCKDTTGCSSSIYACGGHRHDVETVLIYFKNGSPVEVGVSAHGDFTMKAWSQVLKSDNHPKVVYNQHNARTHIFRFADSGDNHAENNLGAWKMPPLLSWWEMGGGGSSGDTLRRKFNQADFGSASLKFVDSKFSTTVNDNKPTGFPTF